MSSTQPLPRVVFPRSSSSAPSSSRSASPSALPSALKQTAKMPRVELENLLRETSAGARRTRGNAAVEPTPPSSVVLPLVTRKAPEDVKK